jgi:hypothetical protein
VIPRLAIAVALGLALQGCAAWGGLALATKVGLITAGATAAAALTNADVAAITEYCKLRNCGSPGAP